MIDNSVERTQMFVSKKMGTDSLFGYPHAERVRLNAVDLASTLGGNMQIIQIACLLNDCALTANNITTHAIESSNVAKSFMETDLKFPTVKVNAVVNIIKKHEMRSWAGDFKPETLEERIVFDAEVMERLSSLGFLRFVLSAAHLGFKSNELVNLLSSYVKDNYSNIFFEETKNKIELDYQLLSEMLKRIRAEGEF